MRKKLAVSLILFLATATAQEPGAAPYFSPDQLDNLLAPIALYPDPLLAQVLLAATFPDQVDEAQRFLRGNADPNLIDSQPWDVSVKAVAHYPSVLSMMDDRLDWTTSVGQAYVSQPADVMASVQRLRAEAQAAGNLMTNPYEQVADMDGYIDIWPAQPQFVYVPIYDPGIVFFQSGLISFGAAFPIGVWLNHDFDWRGHRIFYHGWEGGTGWIARSRPFVHINNVYVNHNIPNVAVDRSVLNRTVNYNALNRYNSVHRQTNFNSVRQGQSLAGNAAVNNKIIDRNMNPGDSRIDFNRGHQPAPPAPVQPPPQAQVIRPQANRPAIQTPPQQIERPAQPSNNPVFGGNRGVFTPQASSQRGQQSRMQMSQPVQQYRPAPAPAPAPRPPSPPAGGGRR